MLASPAALDLVQSGGPRHQGRDLGAELAAQVSNRVAGDLDRVVQQRRAQHLVIRGQPGQDGRDGQRVRDVRVTAQAGLPVMPGRRHVVGPADEVSISVRPGDPAWTAARSGPRRGIPAAPPTSWPPAWLTPWKASSASRWPRLTTPGQRRDWIKIKNIRHAEVIICGLKPGQGRRTDTIGSLLLGVWDGPRLRYAGHVGTGFTQGALTDLTRRLRPLQRGDSPFSTTVSARHARSAQWVHPHLVGEVAYTEWTSDEVLRHPSWRGLRTGKNPSQAHQGN
jgi:hypothetical protein